MIVRTFSFIFFFLALTALGSESKHPRLALTGAEIQFIRENLGKYPLFDTVFNQAKARIDEAIRMPMDVPIPRDAGGYTHERHKRNYVEMQTAGILYQVTKDERYARFIRDLLLKYADLYPTLKIHPMAFEEVGGKLFWQTLNETVWLVNTSQAYDCVYDFLSREDRRKIEENVLKPLARSFTIDHAAEHDRIHNHGTWMTTAVGMLGYAIGDTDLVAKALYGTKKDHKGGFMRQIDLLFSPDGYYTEGAYYVRYAILPFMLFAQAIENNQPEMKIFEYRNQVLKKALYSALQLTYTDGKFLPINDALKEMRFTANEVVTALDVVYQHYGADSSLLSIAKAQNTVLLNGAGMQVARDLARTSPLPAFAWKSVELTDGGKGDEGAIGILRSGPVDDQTLLLMKYAGHGLSHGHYDELSSIYYNQGKELLQDYGAVRFINVEPKFGGRYLPETKAWAHQTIAHNTVTVDEKSQYQGKIDIAQKHHADRHFYNSSDPNLQVMSAKVEGTYPGVGMQRTMFLVKDEKFPEPIVIDIFRATSNEEHQYDLPFYYLGHFIHTNVRYKSFDEQQTPLGKANGYQYLWKEAEGHAASPVQFTWLNGGRYYSITTSADSTTEVFFTRIGAHDSSFNLRSEPGVIVRQKARTHVFASVLEPHGYFEPVSERSDNATGIITSVDVLVSTDAGTIVEIQGKNGLRWTVMVTNGPASDRESHTLPVQIGPNDRTYRWTGNYAIEKK